MGQLHIPPETAACRTCVAKRGMRRLAKFVRWVITISRVQAQHGGVSGFFFFLRFHLDVFLHVVTAMPNTCYVPGCWSEYKGTNEKLSFFCLQAYAEQCDKWKRAIPRQETARFLF